MAETLCSALRCENLAGVPPKLQEAYLKFKTLHDRLGGGPISAPNIALLIMLSGVQTEVSESVPETKKAK